MSKLQKIIVGSLIAILVLTGFAQVSKALTQADVNLLCTIIDCDEAGIRDALNALVDDDSFEITRNLFRGISGDDVEKLQELLAEDPEIYPEGLVTGFYGSLTEQAVARFQEKFGIDSVGVVGPITRGTLNKFFKKHKKGHNIIEEVSIDDDEEVDDDVEDEAPGLQGHKMYICHKGKTLAVANASWQAHERHGDAIGKCENGQSNNDDDDDDSNDDGNDDNDDNNNDDDNNDTDTTAPVINNIEVNTSTSTAVVTWNTDEDADSTVWYSTDSGFETDDEGFTEVDDSDLDTEHSIDIDDLDPNTTYYFIVGSEDDSNNVATSTEDSFDTDAEE